MIYNSKRKNYPLNFEKLPRYLHHGTRHRIWLDAAKPPVARGNQWREELPPLQANPCADADEWGPSAHVWRLVAPPGGPDPSRRCPLLPSTNCPPAAAAPDLSGETEHEQI